MVRLKIEVQGGRLELDKKLLRQTLRAAGTEVAATARQLIRSSAGSGRLYRGRRASAPGQAPVSRSGVLASSMRVKVFKSGEGVSIIDTVFYAKFLQTGARGGGGNTRNRANILLAGERNWRGRVLREQNRMKRSAISQSRVLQPRPFLTIALESREASIAQRVATSINQGIKFVRITGTMGKSPSPPWSLLK